MANGTYYQDPELSELQHDILLTILNPTYFTSSPIISLNKQLNTDNKNIIRAINELLTKLGTTETTVLNSIDEMLKVFGDFNTNTVLKTNMEKISPSVLEALYKVYEDVVGDPDSPTTLPKSVNEEIVDLKQNFTSINSNVDEFLETISVTTSELTKTIITSETNIYLINEDNIKWRLNEDFTVSENVITFNENLPYDMTFSIYKISEAGV